MPTVARKFASMDAAHEAILRMLMEHGEAHGLGGGMADLGRAFGMLGADEDCRGLDDNPERLQPDLIPGVVVRVRRDVTSPSFGWGAVTHDQIGVLRSRNQQDECKVAFESVGQGRWNCRANELEVVPSAENLCYTLVPAPAPPALSAERVASLSVRELKAELCARGVPLAGLAEKPDLIGALLEAPPPPPPPLEAVLRRGDDGLRIGSAVQIRAGLDRPRGGWGDLEDHRHAVGRIVGMRTGAAGLALSGRVTTVFVAFPFSVGTWNAAPDELEAWDGDSTIKVGVCVQVRPGLEVSTPAATPLCTLHPHSHSSLTPPSIHSLASCLARTSLTLVRHLPPFVGTAAPSMRLARWRRSLDGRSGAPGALPWASEGRVPLDRQLVVRIRSRGADPLRSRCPATSLGWHRAAAAARAGTSAHVSAHAHDSAHASGDGT